MVLRNDWAGADFFILTRCAFVDVGASLSQKAVVCRLARCRRPGMILSAGAEPILNQRPRFNGGCPVRVPSLNVENIVFIGVLNFIQGWVTTVLPQKLKIPLGYSDVKTASEKPLLAIISFIGRL